MPINLFYWLLQVRILPPKETDNSVLFGSGIQRGDVVHLFLLCKNVYESIACCEMYKTNKLKEKRRKVNKVISVKEYRGSLGILGCYIVITIILTKLYNNCPLIIKTGLLGEKSFYAGFITNMYNSCLDFLIFTIVLSLILNQYDNKKKIREKIQEIDNCRFWEEPQAAYRIRALVVNLQAVGIREFDLSKCYLKKILIKKLNLIDSKFMGANLCESNIEAGKFENCCFNGAVMKNMIARDTSFVNCEMKYICFEGSNLRNIYIENANLKKADFSKADLRCARFVNCNLEDVEFVDCNLERTIFKHCQNINIKKLVDAKLKYTHVDTGIHLAIKNEYPERASCFSSELNKQE